MKTITFATRNLRISIPAEDIGLGSAFEPQSLALRTKYGRMLIEDPTSSKGDLQAQVGKSLNSQEDSIIELSDLARIDILSENQE